MTHNNENPRERLRGLFYFLFSNRFLALASHAFFAISFLRSGVRDLARALPPSEPRVTAEGFLAIVVDYYVVNSIREPF